MSDQQPLRKNNDVVVIGGGIVGCATAYYLAKAGLRVTLLDKGRLAWEQSSRNWGFVRVTNRGPLEAPAMALGLRLWRELSAELQADIGWVQGGGLSVARNAEELALLEPALALALEHGYDARFVSRAEVCNLLPGFQGDIAGALYNPADALAMPLETTLAFAQAARRLGAELHEYTAAERFEHVGGAVLGVVTPRGEVRGQAVVCAAGVHSRRLARMLGLNLPVRGIRATVAAMAPQAPLTKLQVFGRDVCFRQTPDGQIYIARTNVGSADFDVTLEAFHNLRLFLPAFLANRDMLRVHVGRPLWEDIRRALPWSPARRHPFAHAVDLEPPPNPRTVEACRQAFRAWFPGLGDVPIARTWAGIIDSTPDLIPVLGPVERMAGFFLATGFSGHGFGLGVPCAYLLSQWIVEGKPSLDLHGMRYARFAERDLAPVPRIR